jgi:hypothetical protein
MLTPTEELERRAVKSLGKDPDRALRIQLNDIELDFTTCAHDKDRRNPSVIYSTTGQYTLVFMPEEAEGLALFLEAFQGRSPQPGAGVPTASRELWKITGRIVGMRIRQAARKARRE